eukprot:SAG22_NODE_477_length_9978_cov_2.807268_8_plen_316_part_00
MTTMNGVYELVYFRYTLSVAQLWRARRGLAPDAASARVIEKMCLPEKRQYKNETVYFFTDGSKSLIGHATALGQVYACAHIPCLSHGAELETMRSTLKLSVAEFNFVNACECCDMYFLSTVPLSACHRVCVGDMLTREYRPPADPGDDRAYAMAAARLGEPEIALELLLKNTPTNVFNPNNGQWQGFFPLLTSSNGQLLYAIAMLAGGWDGGQPFAWPSGWAVKVEGFPKLLPDDDDDGSMQLPAHWKEYPYPPRGPTDGIPSNVKGGSLRFYNHFLHGGNRSWGGGRTDQPLRVLVAGAGTGDDTLSFAAQVRQ